MDFSRFEKTNARMFKKLSFDRVAKGKPSKRTLVLHPVFKRFVSRLTDPTELANSFNAIMTLDEKFSFDSSDPFVFLIPPKISAIKQIADIRFSPDCKFSPNCELWFQPRINELVQAFMVDSNLAPQSILDSFPTPENHITDKKPNPYIEVHDLGIDLVALDDDVISMNSPLSFTRSFAYHDFTVVSDMRRALESVSQIIGGFVTVSAFGSLSVSIAKSLPKPSNTNKIHLVLIDRTSDLITPLITQVSYEGLIQEFFGLDCGAAYIPKKEGVALQLFSGTIDNTFKQICKLNHQEASIKIKQLFDNMQQVVEAKDSPDACISSASFAKKAHTIAENKTLVEHMNIISEMTNRMTQNRYFRRNMNKVEGPALQGTYNGRELLQEMLEMGADFDIVLRVICLESLLRGQCQGYSQLVGQLVFNYGLQMYPLLVNLQECGLLSPAPMPRWSTLIRPLNLFDPEYREHGDDVMACYDGYAPISIRLVQKVVSNEFQSAQKVMSDVGVECYADEAADAASLKQDGEYLVCFIGGCTHSELNSFRRLTDRGPASFKVLTTDLFGSKSFFEHLAEGIPGFNGSTNA